VQDEAAADVMQKLKRRFGETTPATIADESFQAADKYLGRLCIFRKGNYIGGYAIIGDADPVALGAQCAARLP